MNAMTENYPEDRKFKRIYFSAKDAIVGQFTPSVMDKDTMSALILNLSAGGMGLALNKKHNHEPEIGNVMTLTDISHSDDFYFLKHIEMEIKWVMNNPALNHILVGCEFITVPDDIVQRIDELSTLWHPNGNHPKTQ